MKTKEEILQIFKILAEDNPTPQTELKYINDYTLLVAIILSAQATDNSVNKATLFLFNIASSPEAMVTLGEEKLKNYIKSIGLFNSKAKNIIAMSEILLKHFNGVVPKDFNELIKLPGVGRKTANVWLNCAYNIALIAVDTHVFRVSNRLGLTNTKSVIKCEETLMQIIPPKYLLHAHHWLILHGRYICIARKPKCEICKLKNLCNEYARLTSKTIL